MVRTFVLAAVIAIGGCAAAADTPAAVSSPSAATAMDDGTYLKRIDPLGGPWQIERIGNEDFARHKASVDFSGGGFLNHGAGCGGGHPAFYRLDDETLTITRREPVRIGKCGPGAAAAQSERRLTAFLDQTVAWSRPDDRTLILVARDGTRALLRQPIEPHPDLAGRWRIESIGGERLVTERRPATLTIHRDGIGVGADCNGTGGSFVIPAPGRITVTGPLLSTLIGCAAEDLAEDALMTRALTSARTYRIERGTLVITGDPGMVLRRPPPPDRRLAGEYEACGNTLLGGYHEGPVTLAIDRRTMRDNAGCTADYDAKGPDLTVRPRAGPACAGTAPAYTPGEPVGIGGRISTLAVARPDGFGFDDQNRLILRTDRGLLSMCRKGADRPFGS